MTYFVQLSEANTTINLAHIASIEWDYVAQEGLDPIYTTTVCLSTGGGLFITRNDAAVLWKALQHYNARYTQAVVALPQLVNTLAALLIPLAESEETSGGVGGNGTTAASANNSVPVAQPTNNGAAATKVNRERARAVSTTSSSN